MLARSLLTGVRVLPRDIEDELAVADDSDEAAVWCLLFVLIRHGEGGPRVSTLY